jgi:hypothetical protein
MDLPDTVGSEHPNLASVRTEAVESVAERLRGRLLDKLDVSAWMMNVTDQAGVTVLILSMAATVHIVNAPVAGQQTMPPKRLIQE